VIGGGPAGLEAARVASERGHRVTLFERAPQLGGALRWAAILHPENEPFLHYLRGEVKTSGVKVELGQAISANDVVDLRPDAVVVATGGRITVPTIPGDRLSHVRTGPALRELLARWTHRVVPAKAVRLASRAWLPIGRRVAVIGGDLVAVELAEFLARRGRLVSILESGKQIAPEVGNKRRTEHMDRLDRLGVTVHVRTAVERITEEAVVFTPAAGSPRQLPVDTVVVAGVPEPDTAMFDALMSAMPEAEVHAAGDCTGLGLIRKATEDGARAACAI
jgi:2,4-dienoyl-CoA reductase (NADPH2)